MAFGTLQNLFSTFKWNDGNQRTTHPHKTATVSQPRRDGDGDGAAERRKGPLPLLLNSENSPESTRLQHVHINTYYYSD